MRRKSRDSRKGRDHRAEAENALGPALSHRPPPLNPAKKDDMPSAVYNPQQPMVCYRRLFLLMLPLVLLVPMRGATVWEEPAGKLAGQIAAIAGPGPAKLTVKNRSSIPAEQLPAIRRLLEHDLNAYGVTLSSSAAAVTLIRVTLTQNARQGLWIAEVQEGTEVNVAMVSTDVQTAAPVPEASVILRKTLLLAQPAPILDVDFILLGGERRMVVLDAERLALYRMTAGAWVKDQSFDIPHSRPDQITVVRRDPRGRIVTGTGTASGPLFEAYLPGVLCSGSDSNGQVTFSCADSDAAWPIGSQKAFYNATRNYFTGVLAPGFGSETSPFYSAAEYDRSGGTVAVFSQVNGQVVLYDKGARKSVTGTRDWGSDITGVRSGCGMGSLLLVSSAGAAATDSVRAYELPGKEAIAVSTPTSLDGTVTAMWPASDGATATVVLRKQQPVQYEAYDVSFLCN